MKKSYWNKDYARRFVINILRKKGYKQVRSTYVNQFGHTLIRAEKQDFYYIFKREHFKSFKYQFPAYQKTKGTLEGEGESINKEYLYFCLRRQCKLLFCYQDYVNAIYILDRKKLKELLNLVYPEDIYSGVLDVALLKIFCETHDLVRTQKKTNVYKANDYSGSTIMMNETTYSFPFALLKRYDERKINYYGNG